MGSDGDEVLGRDPAVAEEPTPEIAVSLHRIAEELAKLVEVMGQPQIDTRPERTGYLRDMVLDKQAKRRPGPNDQPMPPATKCQECGGIAGKHSPNCPMQRLENATKR